MTCDIPLIPNSSSKNRIYWKKKKREKNKIESNLYVSNIGGLKQYFTIDTEIVLTHFICMGWVKNTSTSTLVFDITQFFLFLNH